MYNKAIIYTLLCYILYIIITICTIIIAICICILYTNMCSTGLLTNTNTHLGLSSVCIYSCDVAVTTELQGYIDRTGRPTLHISE